MYDILSQRIFVTSVQPRAEVVHRCLIYYDRIHPSYTSAVTGCDSPSFLSSCIRAKMLVPYSVEWHLVVTGTRVMIPSTSHTPGLPEARDLRSPCRDQHGVYSYTCGVSGVARYKVAEPNLSSSLASITDLGFAYSQNPLPGIEPGSPLAELGALPI
jgi:hypothetical protein